MKLHSDSKIGLVFAFGIVQTIMTNMPSGFAQLLLLLSFVCLAILAAAGHGIHIRYFRGLRIYSG